MNKLLLILTITVIAPSSCYSSPNKADPQLVLELLNIAGTPKIVEDVVAIYRKDVKEIFEAKIKKELIGVELTSQKTILLEKKSKEILASIDYYFSWENQQKVPLAIWNDSYSKDEIKDLIAFTKTKTGKKFWMKNHLNNDKWALLGQKSGEQFTLDIYKKMDQMINEIKNSN